MSAIISKIEKDSIAYELELEVGDEIISINEIKPKDIIEYSFLMMAQEVDIHIKRKNNEEEIFEIEKDYEDDLGVEFESAVFDRIQPCTNKCIFCFVDQQPKGLRETLYVKDDDWRLSYLQGTYITLTNLKEKEWQRIESFNPDSLYISVHSTNPDIREKMLQNPRARSIKEDLKKLQDLNINIHTQIVLCPEYNDGKHLEETLEDLFKFKKIVESIAIVPIGISKYRKEKLKMVDEEIATKTLDIVDKFNKKFKKNIIMASDEFFLLSKREIPDKKYYKNFAQIEDGVGAIRLLIDDFNKNKKKIKKKLKNKTKLSLFTGASAAMIFKDFQKEIIAENLEFEVIEVQNEFFGEKINVSGLIVGNDLRNSIKKHKPQNVVIPSIMLKDGESEFLDSVKLEDLKNEFKDVNFFVIKDCYKFGEFVDIINSF